jgi:hypothetical protein
MSVELLIDELVLEGVPATDAEPVRAGLAAELVRLYEGDPALPLPAGFVSVTARRPGAGAPAEALGARAAQAIHAGLRP